VLRRVGLQGRHYDMIRAAHQIIIDILAVPGAGCVGPDHTLTLVSPPFL
jgi:hypothetical protein